ncbi:NAD(P)-dependent oxidoreductase [uncultured Planktomarina sp.]|uniref:NAD(P)-dependent oxidoreductase n=1 Tax=uncultured Planktomarina sp. TaxID=1538529 RepID=UPI003261A71B
MDVGFVGVGAMGAAMAGHVARAGYTVLAFDMDPAILANAAGEGVTAADSLVAIATRCEVVVVVVSTDDQSRSVVEALLEAGTREGQVIVIAATNHPLTMIELNGACSAEGVGFVDAPVCFGLKGAIDGDLVSLCGGDAQDIMRIEPVLRSYSRSVEHMGPVGCGQVGKSCNNMMHWAACVANYETLLLAKACGIDAQSMRKTLLKCPAHNTTLERWDSTRFTWHEKDMDMALDLSQQAGLTLPLFGLVDQLVKRLGPDQVKALLYGGEAEYLGQQIKSRNLSDVVSSC